MTPERQRALEALRAWSAAAAPETRARLIEAAWLAGEHNVSALAEAADVTRKTVYADLDSRGIDVRTDRQETPTMQTLTIGGYTGAETDQQREAVMSAIMDKHRAAVADGRRSTEDGAAAWSAEMETALWSFEAAKYHNTLIPFAQREIEAREAAHRALRRLETAWAALRTATAWHAAHHVYVETVHDARRAVEAWRDAAAATQAEHDRLTRQLFHQKAYATYVPEEQRIRIDVDSPKLALVELEETATRRRAIAVETLSLTAGQ